MKEHIHDLASTLGAFLAGLVPSSLGAVVSLLYEPGLSWAQRVTQLWVGVVVSWFVVRAAGAIYAFHPFVLQAAGFVIGMIAYKAAPGFIAGCSTVLAELPGQARDRLLALFPKKEGK